MKVGYARTSTLDQSAGFEAQLRELEVLDIASEPLERIEAGFVDEAHATADEVGIAAAGPIVLGCLEQVPLVWLPFRLGAIGMLVNHHNLGAGQGLWNCMVAHGRSYPPRQAMGRCVVLGVLACKSARPNEPDRPRGSLASSR